MLHSTSSLIGNLFAIDCSNYQAISLLSAGYMVARALGAAPTIADSIIDQLAAPTDRASSAEEGPEQVMTRPRPGC